AGGRGSRPRSRDRPRPRRARSPPDPPRSTARARAPAPLSAPERAPDREATAAGAGTRSPAQRAGPPRGRGPPSPCSAPPAPHGALLGGRGLVLGLVIRVGDAGRGHPHPRSLVGDRHAPAQGLPGLEDGGGALVEGPIDGLGAPLLLARLPLLLLALLPPVVLVGREDAQRLDAHGDAPEGADAEQGPDVLRGDEERHVDDDPHAEVPEEPAPLPP